MYSEFECFVFEPPLYFDSDLRHLPIWILYSGHRGSVFEPFSKKQREIALINSKPDLFVDNQLVGIVNSQTKHRPEIRLIPFYGCPVMGSNHVWNTYYFCLKKLTFTWSLIWMTLLEQVIDWMEFKVEFEDWITDFLSWKRPRETWIWKKHLQ